MSNQPEAQSAVHVHLKLRKLHVQLNQAKKETSDVKTNKQTNKQKTTITIEKEANKQTNAGDWRVKGQGPNIKQTTNYLLHNPFSYSVSISPTSSLSRSH